MKYYIVNMSHGPDIPIDEDEVEYVIQKRAQGKDAICRQGIINFSFYVSITEDKIRKHGYNRDYGRDIFESTSRETLADLFPGIKDKILGLAESKRIS
jgi:hypothetical protein